LPRTAASGCDATSYRAERPGECAAAD